jgi:hypothetical protein
MPLLRNSIAEEKFVGTSPAMAKGPDNCKSDEIHFQNE